MENIPHNVWGEIVFGSSDNALSQSIRRAVKSGVLKKIASNIYTSNLDEDRDLIVKRNQYLILSHLFPGAVLSHRTALEGGVNSEGFIILTYKYTKKIQLPGLTVRLVEGLGQQDGDTPFLEKLFISSRPRAVLENLQASRGKFLKSLPREKIEEYLDRICSIHGVEELQRLRATAKQLSLKLNMQKEYGLLDRMVGELLNTQKHGVLVSPAGKARSKGVPYDAHRVELFAGLAANLIGDILPVVTEHSYDEKGIVNQAFFEAYFSNFIEGTEFEVEEAREIVFENKILLQRTKDAHDILGTYELVSSQKEMGKTPSDSQELVQLLQRRHQSLMSVREEKNPGKFKSVANRVGDTVFVKPELVLGTLEQGFKLYQGIEPGLKRAIYIMFLISEVHPFDDGNGRVARIMMNAELFSANQSKIMIPTVYRDDYLLALRRLSRSGDPGAYVKMLTRAQAFTACTDFSDYYLALHQLQNSNAFARANEGKLQF